MRVPISSRLTTPTCTSGQALGINFHPCELVRTSFGPEAGAPEVLAKYSDAELIQLDTWTRTLASLFSRVRWVNCVLEWVPRTGLTSEGDLVLGQLDDATDIVPNHFRVGRPAEGL